MVWCARAHVVMCVGAALMRAWTCRPQATNGPGPAGGSKEKQRGLKGVFGGFRTHFIDRAGRRPATTSFPLHAGAFSFAYIASICVYDLASSGTRHGVLALIGV